MQLRRALHDRLQLIRFPRLIHVAVDVAVVNRLDRRFGVGEASQDNADRLRESLVGLAQQFDAGHAWHALIGDHDCNRLILLHDLEGLRRVGGRQDFIEVHERKRHRLEDGFLVVNDQNSGSFGFAHSLSIFTQLRSRSSNAATCKLCGQQTPWPKRRCGQTNAAPLLSSASP